MIVDDAFFINRKKFTSIIDGDSSGRVFIFGGGSNAIDIIERLTCDVCCIVDNYKEEVSYKGIPIVGINYLKLNFTKDDIILITPSDSRDIIIQLDRIGISQYLLCDKPWRLDYYYNYPDEDRVDDCVEFYLVDAFEIFHFAPIVLFLRENQINARIVAENSELNTSGKYFDYEKAIRILEANNVEYCEKCNPYSKWAVTTQKLSVLEKYKHKKINMTYGVSLFKENWFTSIGSCDGFDYKWVHGDFQKNELKKKYSGLRIIKIGYPKYGRYSIITPAASFHKKSEKPVLLYLPTWDEFSSINSFAEQINALKDKYYIICKMHHCTSRLPEKENDRFVLKRICDEVLDGNTPIEGIINEADIVLADIKSGIATEVLYLRDNIKMILLWPFNDTDQDAFYKEAFSYSPIARPNSDLSQMVSVLTDDNANKARLVEEFYGDKNEESLNNILPLFYNKGE